MYCNKCTRYKSLWGETLEILFCFIRPEVAHSSEGLTVFCTYITSGMVAHLQTSFSSNMSQKAAEAKSQSVLVATQ